RAAASNSTASPLNTRAPRANAVPSSPPVNCIGSASGARGDTMEPARISRRQPRVVEEVARQPGAFAKLMLPEQLAAGTAGGKIERILAHLAAKAELKDQRPQPTTARRL